MPDPVRFSLVIQEPPAPGTVATASSSGPSALALEPGQLVKGQIVAHALESVEFREVQVQFAWRTDGKGNQATGEGGSESLARDGSWPAGSEHRFSFQIPAPWGPLSYKGKILKVLWFLQVRMDRSLMKSDVVESLPVLLQGTPELERASLGPIPQEKERLEAVKKGRVGTWVAVGSIFLLMGVLFGAARGWNLGPGGQITTFLLIGGGLLISLKGLWGRLGRGKLGEPTVYLSTTELRRGEEIRFSVSLRPDQRTELRSLEAILECEERVIHGHGQYQTRHKRTVFERRMVLATDTVVEPFKELRRKGSVTIPRDAFPSFGAPHNQLLWWLRFRADIVGWPDWNEPVLLTVWP